MASARGSGRGAPSGVEGQSGVKGGKAPLKLKAFELSNIQWKRKNALVFSTL